MMALLFLRTENNLTVKEVLCPQMMLLDLMGFFIGPSGGTFIKYLYWIFSLYKGVRFSFLDA